MYSEQNPESVKIKKLADDTVIIIQTEFQRKKISEIKSSATLGLDSTHCTTRYGFLLTNLMLIGRSGGIPVAHMISSDEKQSTIDIFLNEISPQFKSFKHITLVTDDYPAYINSWTNCIGKATHINCFWHIKQNVKLNLRKNKITGIIKIIL